MLDSSPDSGYCGTFLSDRYRRYRQIFSSTTPQAPEHRTERRPEQKLKKADVAEISIGSLVLALPLVAIKRMVIVSFPAVFAATVVDSLHD